MGSILPDPDVSYLPSKGNAVTWLVSIAFETGLLILDTIALDARAYNILEYLQPTLGICRVVSLTSAFLLFVVPTKLPDDEEIETPPLIDVESGGDYGTLPSLPNPKKSRSDAQSTGWLDYLVGFTKLFKYIW